MPALGQHNTLSITRRDIYGVFVDAGEWGEILLPNRQAPRSAAVGDNVTVFLYRDSADAVVATTATPLAQVGEYASLKVVENTPIGAFLDWGLPKDLLLPLGEQAYPVQVGNSYVVRVYVDAASARICASTKLHHFLPETSATLTLRQPVDLLICGKTELGYKAIVDGSCLGLIYHAENAQPLRFGERMKGWVKAIRADGKIDLSITTLDQDSRAALEQQILDYLHRNGGAAPLSDRSTPEQVFALFRASKKNFKRALGNLYKNRLIEIADDHIALV